MRLEGRTAVVTGGGSGIGLAIACRLADEGCRVAIGGRRAEVVQSAAANYRGPGQPPLAHRVDVGDSASSAEFFAWARSELGRIDLLVNSAGVNVARRSMAELSLADWEQMLRINATGSFLAMRAVLPEMRARGDGLIINIASVSGKRATLLGGVGYDASKFAQSALGTATSLEVGREGVRVTTIYPGEVNTPILENRPVPPPPEHRARILQPEDLADAVLMVACLPPRAHVPELVIKPTWQEYY